MSRVRAALLLVAAVSLLPLNAVRADDVAVEAKRAAEVRKLLTAPVKFAGFDDPETKLEEAFEHLTKVYGVRFEIYDQAFRDELVASVASDPIGHPIPGASDIALETVLRRVLKRMPSTSGATFVVRGGVVEITTRRATSPSHWREPSEDAWQLTTPPEVSATFDKRELQEALQQIADATGVNVVLDARAKDKGKTPVTMTLRGVAVDTAVQLLADMADLTAVPVDTVLYVTTKENAEAIRKEQEKRRAAQAVEPKAARAEPAPLKAETERLLKDNADAIRRIKEAVERQRQPEPAPNKDK